MAASPTTSWISPSAPLRAPTAAAARRPRSRRPPRRTAAASCTKPYTRADRRAPRRSRILGTSPGFLLGVAARGPRHARIGALKPPPAPAPPARASRATSPRRAATPGDEADGDGGEAGVAAQPL